MISGNLRAAVVGALATISAFGLGAGLIGLGEGPEAYADSGFCVGSWNPETRHCSLWDHDAPGYEPPPTSTTSTTAPPDLSERVWGSDRYVTAVAVSQLVFPDGATVAYVATGENYPDALGGASLGDGPVLLTPTGSLSSATAAEIARLAPDEIVVLGGIGAVSANVETALEALAPKVTRLGGADRFTTAELISRRGWPDGASVVYLANGLDFPDALSAAGGRHAPILLTLPDQLPTATARELARLDPDLVIIVGGTSVINDTLETALDATYNTLRLSGPNRFATGAAVIKDAFTPCVDLLLVATGENFPDALTAAAGDHPLLLVSAATVHSEVTAELTRLQPTRIVIVGGTGAISVTVSNTIQTYETTC